jgi:hypothetical protein
MGWTRPEIFSAIALLISAGGVGLSIFALWRTHAAEKPIAWLVIQASGIPDCWIANINLRNRSKVTLRAHSVSVPIRTVPISKKQDFFLGDYETAWCTTASGERVLSSDLASRGKSFKLSFDAPPSKAVQPDEVGTFPVLLFRGTLSHATSVRMQFCIQTMEAKPRFKILTVTSTIPGGGLTIVVR